MGLHVGLRCHESDASKNVTFKKSDFAFFEILARLPQLASSVCKCRRTPLDLNSEQKYPSLKREREIRRHFIVKLGNSRRDCSVTAKKCTKRRDARAKLLFCRLFWRSTP